MSAGGGGAALDAQQHTSTRGDPLAAAPGTLTKAKVGARGAPRAAEGVLGVPSTCLTCRVTARVP